MLFPAMVSVSGLVSLAAGIEARAQEPALFRLNEASAPLSLARLYGAESVSAAAMNPTPDFFQPEGGGLFFRERIIDLRAALGFHTGGGMRFDPQGVDPDRTSYDPGLYLRLSGDVFLLSWLGIGGFMGFGTADLDRPDLGNQNARETELEGELDFVEGGAEVKARLAFGPLAFFPTFGLGYRSTNFEDSSHGQGVVLNFGVEVRAQIPLVMISVEPGFFIQPAGQFGGDTEFTVGPTAYVLFGIGIGL